MGEQDAWLTTLLNLQISGLREVFGQSSEEEDEESEQSPQTDSLSPPPHDSLFFLDASATAVGMSGALQHPSRSQIYALCTNYLEKVDPLFKLLHGPSLSKYMREGQGYLDYPPGHKAVEALAFAVYYTSTTSLSELECLQQIGEDKPSLLAKFRSGMEIALVRADLVNTNDMSTLQALVLLLVRL